MICPTPVKNSTFRTSFGHCNNVLILRQLKACSERCSFPLVSRSKFCTFCDSGWPFSSVKESLGFTSETVVGLGNFTCNVLSNCCLRDTLPIPICIGFEFGWILVSLSISHPITFVSLGIRIIDTTTLIASSHTSAHHAIHELF